jgi:hypothetical protein
MSLRENRRSGVANRQVAGGSDHHFNGNGKKARVRF